jgi:transposase
LIQEKLPEQLKTDFALWTRDAVMLLIERECGVKMIVRTVGKLLKRWGLTPQKPTRRALYSTIKSRDYTQACTRRIAEDLAIRTRRCGVEHNS